VEGAVAEVVVSLERAQVDLDRADAQALPGVKWWGPTASSAGLGGS
jgi:hypothetical protein